ncbi:MAG: class I SAM-dependent methyltransferase [bacterium]
MFTTLDCINKTKDTCSQDTPSITLGAMTSHILLNDPEYMACILSRYKFCMRLLQGKSYILEVGCGDAFGTPIIAKAVKHLMCIDHIKGLIADNKKRLKSIENIEFHTMDIIKEVPDRIFDAAFSLNVIEYIEPDNEDIFINNICRCLSHDGVFIIGTPNCETVKYATDKVMPQINRKSHSALRRLLDKFFLNTFIFSMNDEIVYAGFYPFAHYFFGLGVGLKEY